MKKLLLVLFSISLFLFAQNNPIKFYHENWGEVLKVAKEQNKMIFLDAYASWCGPCKYMSNVIFTNDTVGNFYNNNFINAKFDMEKGEGLELAKKYEVRVYPTLLYLNPDGEVIHRIAGSMNVSDFVEEGKIALNGKNLKYYQNEFANGRKDEVFIKEYISLLQKAYLDAKDVLDVYFSNLKEEDRTKSDNLNLIFENVDDITSDLFKLLISNLDKLNKPENEIVDGLKYKFRMDLITMMRKNSNANYTYDMWLERTKDLNFKLKDELFAYNKIMYFQRLKDWKNYLNACEIYLTKYQNSNAKPINEICWNTYRMLPKDNEALNFTEKWIKKALELERDEEILDTYANILFAKGDKNNAIKIEEEAIELAKKKNKDIENYIKTLEKFKK
jgi:thiol-disulfide isomerase/thioredoxin